MIIFLTILAITVWLLGSLAAWVIICRIAGVSSRVAMVGAAVWPFLVIFVFGLLCWVAHRERKECGMVHPVKWM